MQIHRSWFFQVFAFPSIYIYLLELGAPSTGAFGKKGAGAPYIINGIIVHFKLKLIRRARVIHYIINTFMLHLPARVIHRHLAPTHHPKKRGHFCPLLPLGYQATRQLYISLMRAAAIVLSLISPGCKAAAWIIFKVPAAVTASSPQAGSLTASAVWIISSVSGTAI